MVTLTIKKYLFSSFAACGLFAALDRCLTSGCAFVLMYHRVLEKRDFAKLHVQPGMYVTSSSFERQICFLKRKYRVLPLEELIDKIKRKEMVGGCCAITFDDGWVDNHANAFPLLIKHQVPATIFLATNFIGTNRLFWPEEICSYLDQSFLTGKPITNSPPYASSFCSEISKYRAASREVFMDKVIEVLKRYSPEQRNRIIEFFRGVGKSESLPRQMLSWEEVDEMDKSGLVTFGAHTAGHEMLDQVPTSKAESEISQSKKDIERRLGGKVSIFAYPNGNYNEKIQDLLCGCGFVGAVTTRKGYLTKDTPLLEIPRIGMHEDVSNSIPTFWGRILLGKLSK